MKKPYEKPLCLETVSIVTHAYPISHNYYINGVYTSSETAVKNAVEFSRPFRDNHAFYVSVYPVDHCIGERSQFRPFDIHLGKLTLYIRGWKRGAKRKWENNIVKPINIHQFPLPL